TIQACLQKAHDRFDGGAMPEKACFARLEAKNPGACLTTNDTATMENATDAFVTDVVTELDPGYPVAVENACSAGKKKCVGKKTAGLLRCHVKNEKPPGVDEATYLACLQRMRDKFDGGTDPTRGCFAKLETKFSGACLTTNDTAALEAK